MYKIDICRSGLFESLRQHVPELVGIWEQVYTIDKGLIRYKHGEGQWATWTRPADTHECWTNIHQVSRTSPTFAYPNPNPLRDGYPLPMFVHNYPGLFLIHTLYHDAPDSLVLDAAAGQGTLIYFLAKLV